MERYSVFDEAFAPYGRVYPLDTETFLTALEKTPLPESGVVYVPSEPVLEAQKEAVLLEKHIFGGMPVQIGYCNGHNHHLGCLEYHLNSEINIPADDIVLLAARREEMSKEGRLNTSCVKAFSIPKGTVVELYATTLHYAPAQEADQAGFRVAIVLPRGTNTDKPVIEETFSGDKLLWGRNKWLIAHETSEEAQQGAFVGLEGPDIDLARQ